MKQKTALKQRDTWPQEMLSCKNFAIVSPVTFSFFAARDLRTCCTSRTKAIPVPPKNLHKRVLFGSGWRKLERTRGGSAKKEWFARACVCGLANLKHMNGAKELAQRLELLCHLRFCYHQSSDRRILKVFPICHRHSCQLVKSCHNFSTAPLLCYC